MDKKTGGNVSTAFAVACLTAVLIFAANYLVFMLVPNERSMGPVQRIFYFHVGSALACYVAFGIVFISALAYLGTRQWKFDALAAAASEVGLTFCTIVLLTGMIWAKSSWNTYFRWEPRLVTFLILWLIFLATVLLRAFGSGHKTAVNAAILGILGALNIPLVVFAIKFLPQSAQLHPQVREVNTTMQWTLVLAAISLILLQGLLVWIAFKLECAKRLASQENLNG